MSAKQSIAFQHRQFNAKIKLEREVAALKKELKEKTERERVRLTETGTTRTAALCMVISS